MSGLKFILMLTCMTPAARGSTYALCLPGHAQRVLAGPFSAMCWLLARRRSANPERASGDCSFRRGQRGGMSLVEEAGIDTAWHAYRMAKPSLAEVPACTPARAFAGISTGE